MCVYLITTLMCEQAGKVDPDGQAAGPGGAAHSELLPQLPDLGRGGQGRTCCSRAGSIRRRPAAVPLLGSRQLVVEAAVPVGYPAPAHEGGRSRLLHQNQCLCLGF